MTLNEYTQSKSRDNYIYWLEHKLAHLGSIKGRHAFKFGVFSRKDEEEKKSDKIHSYSKTYDWLTSLGSTAEEAFEKICNYVVQVAELAERGDLDGIEAFKSLGD